MAKKKQHKHFYPKVKTCDICHKDDENWCGRILYVIVNGSIVEKEVMLCHEHKTELEELEKRQQAVVATTFLLSSEWVDLHRLPGVPWEKEKHIQVREIKAEDIKC